MGADTKIEWTDHTFNPWEGCQKVGPGCDNCYAEARNARFGGGAAPNWGPGAPRRLTSAANWRKPLAWNADAARFAAEHGRRQRVFCASLADVFDNAVPDMWRADLANLIDATPDLDWLLLTKRIGNAADMLEIMFDDTEPRPNVWIGATIVNQVEADRDVPKLLRTPAAKRFLSMEPLLGPVDLNAVRWDVAGYGMAGALPTPDEPDDFRYWHHQQGVAWVIVGGESGSGARPADGDWYRSLRDQCSGAGVPFLFKQHGEWIDARDLRRLPAGVGPGFGAFDHCRYDRDLEAVRVGKKAAGRLLDGRQHDEMPS